MLLKDKRAIITGGSRGIGKVVASFFLKEGARVMIAARSKEELAEAKRELGKISPHVYTRAVDVSNSDEAKSLVKAAAKEIGGVDILVNAAGIYGPIGPSDSIALDQWKKTFEINLFGGFYLFQEVLPFMKKQKYGKIINFSGGGDGPMANFSAYNTSKAAVARLTETLAEETKECHIDINVVAPGGVNTKILEDALAAGEAAMGRARYESILKQKKEGGVAPEKVAELCVFLASAASDGLSGRFLSAVWDDWKNWDKKKIGEIMKGNEYTLRRVKAK